MSGSATGETDVGPSSNAERKLSRGVTVEEPFLRVVRLRLPGLTEPLYVLRQHGSYVDDDRYPGGDACSRKTVVS